MQDTQSQIGAGDRQQPPRMRKTGRTQKLTERGKALLDDKLNSLNGSLVQKMEISHQWLKTVY